MPEAVKIPDTVWQTELPFAPPFDEFAPGLALALGPGERDGRSTAVAAIRYRMPDPVVRRYRSRLAPAIQLVAIDLVTGAVWASACVGQDGAPTTFDAKAAPDARVGAPAVGGHVNVDIVALLKLPPQAARYAVFAWLDEWVSAPKGLDLPADPKRVESPVRAPANLPPAARAAAAASNSLQSGIHFIGPQADRLRLSWNTTRPTTVVLLGYRLEERTPHWEVLANASAAHALVGIAEIRMPAFLGEVNPGFASFAMFAGGSVSSVGPIR